MSHTSVKHSSSTAQQSNLDGLFELSLKVLLLSIENARTIMRNTQGLMALIPALPSFQSKCPCEIPEMECPPHCNCEVHWDAIPGETVGLSIRVTNSSRFLRNYYLTANPFSSGGASPGTISLTPASLSLAAGGSGVVKATLTVLQVPEGEYDAEIVVNGGYQQFICVRLRVGCKKTCGNECCTCEIVFQDERPVRIKAHQWYHHFQCTDYCVIEPDRRPPDRRD
jgi:hypothetical protein